MVENQLILNYALQLIFEQCIMRKKLFSRFSTSIAIVIRINKSIAIT